MTTTEHPQHWFEHDGHLTRDAFDSLAERDSGVPLPVLVQDHLAGCRPCRERLAELRATIALLHKAPEVIPARSFQIPTPASVPVIGARKQPSALERLQNWLLPSLPALRVATVAVFILFLTTTAAEFWTNGDETTDTASIIPASTAQITGTEPPLAQQAFETAPAESEARDVPDDEAGTTDAAPETELAPAAASEAGAFGGSAADSASDAEESSEDADQALEAAPAPEAENVMRESTALPSPAAEEQATPLAPATPEAIASPLPTDVGQPTGAGDDGWNGWRIAQAVLLAIFVVLLVTLLWLRLSREDRRPQLGGR